MSKVLVLISMLLMSANVFAVDKTPKFSLNWRMDLVKNDTDDTTKTFGSGKATLFEIPYVRLGFKGAIDETMSYRVRFRLNKKYDTQDTSGVLTSADYAHVDKKVSKTLKLRIGKHVLYHGGWEAAPSSKDEYSFSENSFAYYGTGLGIFYKVAGQNFIIQMMNNRNDSNSNQTSPLYGVNWSTSVAGGLINPTITYHVDPFENTTASEQKGSNTYMAVGNRLKVANITWDFDYQLNKFDRTTATGTDTENKGYTTRVALQMGNWRPQLKYSAIEAENSTPIRGVVGDNLDYHIAMEYYPNGDGNFRYHLAHITSKSEPKTGTDIKTTAIKLGMAGSF